MAISVSEQYTVVDPKLVPSENPIKCHEEFLSMQSMFPPNLNAFDNFPPFWGGTLKRIRCVQYFFPTQG